MVLVWVSKASQWGHPQTEPKALYKLGRLPRYAEKHDYQFTKKQNTLKWCNEDEICSRML